MPSTPLQSGDSESSEEEGPEGVISNNTDVAESTDEDKPAATSSSKDSQGVALLSLTPLLVGGTARRSGTLSMGRCPPTGHSP